MCYELSGFMKYKLVFFFAGASENYFILLGESHICKHNRVGVWINEPRFRVLGRPGGNLM